MVLRALHLFSGYNVSMPKGHYDRSKSKWTPPARKAYDPALVNQVRELYDSGLTMREVAAEVGVGVKVLQRLMPRNGIVRRAAMPRDQTGARNGAWRGDDAGYAAMHERVEAARGRPARCQTCGAEPRWIDWANLTGRYEDVNDYAPMCRPCHRAYDAGRRAAS